MSLTEQRRKQPNIDDEKLIALFFDRDEQAVSVTFEKYGGYLCGVARNILSDPGECEECVNDALLSVWEHIPPARPDNFLAYITAAVRNIAIDRYKAAHRQKRIPTEYTACIDELAESIDSGRTVEDEAENRRLAKCLGEFARTLPAEERYAFISRYYFFDSVRDIAAALGLSNSRVYQILGTLKARLRNKLEAEEFL